MRFLLLKNIVLLNFLILASQVVAEEKSQFGCQKPVVVGLYEYGIMYSEKTKSGVDKETAELLAKKTGCEIRFQVKPRARIWQEIETGDLDITLSALKNSDREKFGAFIPYVTGKTLIVLEKSLSNVSSLEDILDIYPSKRVNVGVVRSFSYGEEVDSFLRKASAKGMVIEFPDMASLFEGVEKKQVKVTFGTAALLPDYLKQYKILDKIIIKDITKQQFQAHVVLSRKRFKDSEIENWKKVIREVKSNGELEKIFLSYVPRDVINRYRN